mgnify:FL=1
MRYDRRKGRATRKSRPAGYGRVGRQPPAREPKREGQGLLLLMVQTVLCAAALAVVFTMQYMKPQEYKTLGEYYTKVTAAETDGQDETLRLLATPITAEQLRLWWENWQPPKLAEVFAWAEGELAMGGEESVFPRNVSYRKVLVSVPAMSPLPVDAVITSDYGERTHPISGAWDFHTGIDLAAAAGTPVYPIYAGEVTAVGSSQSYGNYVKLRHCDNLETVYCHCEVVLCREGDRVTVNDVIARVGSTGVSTGPHLHLSVLAEGYYVDPMNLYS